MFHPLPSKLIEIAEAPGSVLLHTLKIDAENYRSFLFQSPRLVLRSKEGETPEQFIARVEMELGPEDYAAGVLPYDIACPPHPQAARAWMGIYSRRITFDHRSAKLDGIILDSNPARERLARARREEPSQVHDISFRVGDAVGETVREEYQKRVDAILHHIGRGDAYQINFCGRLEFSLSGSLSKLYEQLCESQPVSYAALISTDEETILSFSPELFFRREGDLLQTRPMKGTRSRGRSSSEDEEIQSELQGDEKSRAENVMIVDLLRNDLSRIAQPGSVRVQALYEIEKFSSVLQMTSSIKALLKTGTSMAEIFAALFPCGSITGAPKIRSMEIIEQIEGVPRGVYTGAIGYFNRSGDATFNVAIRTIEKRRGEQARMGIGSGIVFDSAPQVEFEECLLKSSFLLNPIPKFCLFETILWENSYSQVEYHLRRLCDSAKYFDFPFAEQTALDALRRAESEFRAGQQYRVKLQLDRFGRVSVESAPLAPLPSAIVRIWPEPVLSTDRFLYHKTTHRPLYKAASQKAREEGLADYIFVNERGEVTEGAISNIFIRRGEKYFTPPVAVGLLPGTYRAFLLETLRQKEQKVFTVSELADADQIFICNALRKLVPVSLQR